MLKILLTNKNKAFIIPTITKALRDDIDHSS